MPIKDLSIKPIADDGRYQFERKLGEGGAGSVFLVRDRETGERLALKRLHRVDDRSVLRLKREFRSLANINHRNVIKLYDLGRSQDVWFLTMEYLDGLELRRCFDTRPSISATVRGASLKVHTDAAAVERVARVFHQLASGVAALHQAGVLHRDLKPSNVIVAEERVVVVDFGLALELGEHAATVTMDGLVAGTPAYMAPEQVQGRDWGEPNDWYAFGVMLYEALCGSLPIDGRMHELLRFKLERDPTPLDELVSGVPRALSELCMQLLSRQPELRPSTAEILAVLHAHSAGGGAPEPRERSETRLPNTRQNLAEPWLFGRDAELEQLTAAMTRVESGSFAAVHVCGRSGAGKSVLVEHFLEGLSQRDPRSSSRRPLILRSRCYEREQVPFKALDAAMDALVTQLSREDDLEVSHVLPSEVQALVQLFPALTRLSAVQRLINPTEPLSNGRLVRDRAEAALCELFARLGARRPVVLWIDDLHWGDLDSARILRSWLEPRTLTGVLLVVSYRSDELSTSPCLRLLSDGESALLAEERVNVGPLTDVHVRAICHQRFAAVQQPAELLHEISEHIVSEAGGSPFLASQLIALALSQLSGSGPDPLEILTIDQLVSRRTALLSEPARRLLHVLSAASRPLPASLALQLAAAGQAARAAQHELAGLGLIRTRDADSQRLLEIYHDRLREAVLARLPAEERMELDRELLRALEAAGSSDVAWLHALALGAGDRQAALRYGRLAAERASSALAFAYAAELYGTCLVLDVQDRRERSALYRKLAAALAHAGQGYQAATAYLEAARYTEGFDALQCKRRAASHLLRSGRFEAGEALVRKVLDELDIQTPSSTAGLIAAIAWERTRATVRGLRYTPRPLESISPKKRYAAEVCATLSIETQLYDPLRAALLQARSLRAALDAGVPELLARALCVAATMAAVTGGLHGAHHGDELLERAAEIAKSLNAPLIDSNINSARAVCAFLQTRMSDVVKYSDAFERSCRAASGGSDEGEYYHRFTVLSARIMALLVLGQHRQGKEELRNLVNEARSTENICALLTLSGLRTRVELDEDRARDAVRRLELEYEQLPREQYGLLHIYHMSSVMRVGCATRDYAWVERWTSANWQRFQASIFKRRGMLALIVPALHARMVINQGIHDGQSAAEVVRRAAQDLQAMKRFSHPEARAVCQRLQGRLAYLAGDRAKAAQHWQQSLALFDNQVITRDEAARDRYAYGTCLGGDAGAALQASAIETLQSLGVTNAPRDLESYYPELLASASPVPSARN